jgi:hypothetical protein
VNIAQTYASIGVAPSPAQLALSQTIIGEECSGDGREIRRLCSGRDDIPALPFQEVTGIIGRKGGKTERIAAPILIHRAATDEDEPGVYLLCAPSRGDQAVLGWQAVVNQMEWGFPNLIAEVKESDGRVLLRNGNVIRIQSANFRSLRGPKYKVVVVDEACFFTSDDPELGFANPLEYVLDSVAGGMIATANPLLLLLSTPWVKDGVVWQQYRDRDANPDRLVWQSSTLVMNPFANQALMEKHRRDRGEAFYQREYMARFSEDTTAFIDSADVDAAISDVPFFVAKQGVRYVLGLDPGRRRDHFGAAIAHREGERIVIDWAVEWKPSLLSGLKYADILPQVWRKARRIPNPQDRVGPDRFRRDRGEHPAHERPTRVRDGTGDDGRASRRGTLRRHARALRATQADASEPAGPRRRIQTAGRLHDPRRRSRRARQARSRRPLACGHAGCSSSVLAAAASRTARRDSAYTGCWCLRQFVRQCRRSVQRSWIQSSEVGPEFWQGRMVNDFRCADERAGEILIGDANMSELENVLSKTFGGRRETDAGELVELGACPRISVYSAKFA